MCCHNDFIIVSQFVALHSCAPYKVAMCKDGIAISSGMVIQPSLIFYHTISEYNKVPVLDWVLNSRFLFPNIAIDHVLLHTFMPNSTSNFWVEFNVQTNPNYKNCLGISNSLRLLWVPACILAKVQSDVWSTEFTIYITYALKCIHSSNHMWCFDTTTSSNMSWKSNIALVDTNSLNQLSKVHWCIESWKFSNYDKMP